MARKPKRENWVTGLLLQIFYKAVVNRASQTKLIIDQEKTKKITTVSVVWICDPNYHKILPTLALNFSKNY